MTDNQVVFRTAKREDLSVIVSLIADDGLGRGRESEIVGPDYLAAFEAITIDHNQMMAVAEINGEVIGYMQISFIPGLSRKGAWRGQIESVRISSDLRGRGIGRLFFQWAIEQCEERKCSLVQLTTDKRRDDALRFYEALGFVPSHNGMKLQLG